MSQPVIVRVLGVPVEHTDLGEGSSVVTQSAEVRVTIIGHDPVTREVPEYPDTTGDVNRAGAVTSV